MSRTIIEDGYVYIFFLDEVLPVTRVFKYELEARRLAEKYKKDGLNAYVWKRKIE